MTNLKGKWALLTGASRGIGCEIARCMAKQGCNLILHSRVLAHTEKIAQEIEAIGVETFRVAAELEKLDQVHTMLDAIEAKGLHVDVLLNNAGVQVAYRQDYWQTPASDYTTSFLVNTTAPAMICYRLIPKMIGKGFGRVVNTTSGIQLEAEQAGYSASKAALDKITIDLGYKLQGTDVIINLTDPGWCRTDLGGPHAHNSVESAVPGVVVGAFMDDQKSGRYFRAQEYAGMTLEEAVAHAATVNSPY